MCVSPVEGSNSSRLRLNCLLDVFFPEGDGIHSPSSIDRHYVEGVKTFVMQWGRFLRIQRDSFEAVSVNQEDLELVLGAIVAAYGKLGLPLEGAAPGQWNMKIPDEDETFTLDIMIPPCEWAVFDIPWEDMLLDRYRGTVITRPIMVAGLIPAPLSAIEGDRYVATTSPLSVLLEDLDCVTKEVLVEDVIFDDEYMEQYKARIKGEDDRNKSSMLAKYVVLKVPDWWFDAWLPFHDTPELVDVDKSIGRITSLWGP